MNMPMTKQEIQRSAALKQIAKNKERLRGARKLSTMFGDDVPPYLTERCGILEEGIKILEAAVILLTVQESNVLCGGEV